MRILDEDFLSFAGLPASVAESYESSGISELLDWQEQCLRTSNALDGRSLVYSAPTGSGKTLVAELIVLRRILTTGCKAIFILPFISVAREQMLMLQSRFRHAGLRVEGYMGSLNPCGGFETLDVAVCTIEKSNALINRLIEEEKLHLIGSVVIDELHTIGDPSRGYLLELLLSKLRYLSTKRDFQLQVIGMSATLPNTQLLSTWLNAEMYQTDFRPIPLQERLKVDQELFDAHMQPTGALAPAFCLANDSDNLIGLCLETILAGHSLLIFCQSKVACEKLSETIAKRFFSEIKNEGPHATNLATSLGKEKLQAFLATYKQVLTNVDAMLAKTLAFGVAFHHAGLTMEERFYIENGFRQGVIRVLIATSTLSSGVNLPARRVIIRSLFGQPGKPGPQLTPSLYKQMCGRAGRKGIDTEG